jgi:thioredoxin-related protein
MQYVRFLPLFILLSLLACSSPHPIPTVPLVQKIEHQIVKTVVKVNWRGMEAASLKEATSKDKIIILFFSIADCKYCEEMDSVTLQNEKIIKLLNDNFIPIKIVGDDTFEIMNTFGMEFSFPSTAFLLPTGEFITSFSGYLNPEVFAAMLQKIVDVKAEAEKQTSPIFENDTPTHDVKLLQ